MILLSIITINLNNAAGLKKTLNSVLSQSFNDYEFIVIDGGSNDGSVELIKQYSGQLTYWISELDEGIYHAMNKGLKIAAGKYCLFLNSGDWLAENILDQIKKYLSDDIDIVYGHSYLAYSEERIEALRYPDSLSMRHFYQAAIGHQSTFIKRTLLNQYNGYDETFKIHGDYDFWLKSIVRDNSTTRLVPLFISYYDMKGISSYPNPWAEQEHQVVLEKYLPKLVLKDYDAWQKQMRQMEILMWYKRQPLLHGPLVLVYKVIKNVRKLLKLKY